jgi:hypothetical protein
MMRGYGALVGTIFKMDSGEVMVVTISLIIITAGVGLVGGVLGSTMITTYLTGKKLKMVII